MQKIKSRYGVYYDMSQSPYQYHDGKTGYVLYFPRALIGSGLKSTCPNACEA